MAAVAPAASTRPTPETVAKVEAYLQEQLTKKKVPGAAFAIVHGSETVWAEGFGTTAAASGRPVTPDTLFEIGSLTKGMTALATLQLVERGLLELDAPVRRYLPWFAVADEGASAAITVRHCLDQVTGLPNGAWKVALVDPSVQSSLEKAVRALHTVKLISKPGEKWMYCNMNYSILGLLIEVVTGTPYPQHIQENLFQPLGMEGSCFDRDVIAQRDHADLHIDQFGKVIPIPLESHPWAAPAGVGLQCSLRDMVRYAAFQLEGPGLINRETLQGSHWGNVDPNMKDVRYGLGWFNMADFHGARLVMNYGGTGGHASVLCLLPDLNLAVTGMFSLNTGFALKVGLNIIRILRGQEPNVPDVFPDFSGIFFGLINGLMGLGALGAASLALAVVLGWKLGAVLAVILTLLGLLMLTVPRSLLRNMLLPLPTIWRIGPGGWPLGMVIGWWMLVASVAGWGIYGLLTAFVF